jgi:hypothetical protein
MLLSVGANTRTALVIMVAGLLMTAAGCSNATQSRAHPAAGAVASATAGQLVIWRIAAAAKAAALAPHGDIGDAAVATAP